MSKPFVVGGVYGHPAYPKTPCYLLVCIPVVANNSRRHAADRYGLVIIDTGEPAYSGSDIFDEYGSHEAPYTNLMSREVMEDFIGFIGDYLGRLEIGKRLGTVSLAKHESSISS